MSVYYMRYTLIGVELKYPLNEKFAYALVLASRKLCSYFKVHKATVLTDQPLKNVLQNLDAFGRLLKWAVELSWYGIDFKSWRTIKG